MCRKSVTLSVVSIVALGLLLGAVGCRDTGAETGASGAAVTSGPDSGSIYTPARYPPGSENDSETYGRVVATADDLQQSLTFDLVLPDGAVVGPVTEYRLLGDEVPTDANSAYLLFGEQMGMFQALSASESEAREQVFDIARSGQPDIDDRFVKRVAVRGCEGYVWDAVNIPPVTDASGGFRPGITIPYAALVWNEGSRLFLLHGLTIDGEQLIQVAESLR